MTSIQPELWVERAGQAMAFYADAFGARVLHQVGQGDDIVAQLAVSEAAFWVAAAGPERGRFSPAAIGGATSRTLLVADDPDAVVRRAIDAGATQKSAVSDEHGWRLGRIVDPFGHKWDRQAGRILATALKPTSRLRIQERARPHPKRSDGGMRVRILP
jgi:PhnB protein